MEVYNAVLLRQVPIQAASTYSTLSGKATQIYLCATGAGCCFSFSSAAITATGTFFPLNIPILIPCPHPSYLTAITATGGTGTLTAIEYI